MKGDQLYRSDRPSFNVARLRMGGEKFEVVIHPEAAIEFRHGRKLDLRDVVVSDKIFADAHKGLLASENMIKSLFKEDGREEVVKSILMKGEIQLTAEYREKLREQKWKWIIQLIHRNGIDPRTNLPHPPQRIENALLEAKVRLDEHKRAEDQIQDVLKKIRHVLPIKFEVRELSVRIPAQYAPKAFPVLKAKATVLKDEWLGDGSLSCVVEVPAGLQQDLFDQLNRLTHGNVESKMLRTK